MKSELGISDNGGSGDAADNLRQIFMEKLVRKAEFLPSKAMGR